MEGSRDDPTWGWIDSDRGLLKQWQSSVSETVRLFLDPEFEQSWMKLRGRTEEAATLAAEAEAFREELVLIRQYVERLIDLHRQRLESLGETVRIINRAIEVVFHGNCSKLPASGPSGDAGELRPQLAHGRRRTGQGCGSVQARLLLPRRRHGADPSIALLSGVRSIPTVLRSRVLRCVTCRWVGEKSLLLTYKARGLRYRVHVGRRRSTPAAGARSSRHPVPRMHHIGRRRPR